MSVSRRSYGPTAHGPRKSTNPARSPQPAAPFWPRAPGGLWGLPNKPNGKNGKGIARQAFLPALFFF